MNPLSPLLALIGVLIGAAVGELMVDADAATAKPVDATVHPEPPATPAAPPAPTPAPKGGAA